MELKDIRKVSDLKGKRVLLRSTLNAPIEGGKILNDYRLRRSLETINFLRESGAKVILAGHIGKDDSMSLSHVYRYFKTIIPVSFTDEVLGEKTDTKIKQMHDGDIVLLENLRKHKGELTNDDRFAEELASLAEIYVNDAFSASHRRHASIIGLPKYLPSYIGILFAEEVKELSKALNPISSSLCILGGVKFSTKESLIKKIVDIYDRVFISGALAHDFFKVHGFNVGKSLTSNNGVDIRELALNKKIAIPSDVTVENKNGVFVKKPDEVLDDDNIVDAGPETMRILKRLVQESKFILWNGPLGEYERGFIKQTEILARAIAESSAKTLVGGGDTIAAIEHLCLEDKFSFISTGGGAMLQFLLDGTLVGIEALKNSR